MGHSVSENDMTTLMAKRKAHLAFCEWLNRLTAYPGSWLHNLPDETIVCRCEDITAGNLRKAVDMGHNTPLALKRFLRLGMGPCQGRTCLPIAYDFLAGYRTRPLAKDELLSTRPPLKPVPLGHLLDQE
jgi:NAD(P)H-nitrite reductase large subunit